MARGHSVRFYSSADLRSLLAAVGLGERTAFWTLAANPRSDDIIEEELIWTRARGVDGVVDCDQALLAAGAPASAAIGPIYWLGGSAAAIPACGHLRALETFRPGHP